VNPSLDLYCALLIGASLGLALLWNAIAYLMGRPIDASRVARELPLPLVGRAPMVAVYRPIITVGRLLVGAGVPANAVTVASF
jgi:hypothetical protein